MGDNPTSVAAGAKVIAHQISKVVSPPNETSQGRADDGSGNFRERELKARREATHNIFYLFLVNGYSAIVIFVLRLISLDGLFGIALSVSLTIYVYNSTEDNTSWDGGIMNWVLLTFAVVTPMSASIGMAFRRREQALQYVARIRATILGVYSAFACWDWRKEGKQDTGRAASSRDWLEFSDEALTELLGIGSEMSQFLALPTATRARNRVTKPGRKEAEDIMELGHDLFASVLLRMGRLTMLTEILKAEGLPPNEATRIRQWERFILQEAEALRMIKNYRTPQALRSFARLFTVFLPPLYCPYYAQMARDLDSLGVGILFAVLTSLALTSLFESISQMEDPFVAHMTLDGIDIVEELHVLSRRQLLLLRAEVFFTSAPEFPCKMGSEYDPGSSLQARILTE